MQPPSPLSYWVSVLPGSSDLSTGFAPVSPMSDLTHFDASGASRMVDVGDKPITLRMARAEARLTMAPATLTLIRERKAAKGDVFEVARLAGIMAAKRTSELIPLCHLLPLESAAIDFEFLDDQTLRVEAVVRTQARTGVEMEALTAVTVAALTVYDMCKAVDRGMAMTLVRLLEKSGGRSGTYLADQAPPASNPADAGIPSP